MPQLIAGVAGAAIGGALATGAGFAAGASVLFGLSGAQLGFFAGSALGPLQFVRTDRAELNKSTGESDHDDSEHRDH